MARPSSKIMQTPAEKKAAVGNLKTSLKAAREPLDVAEGELKAATKALEAADQAHTKALAVAQKAHEKAIATATKEHAAARKALAKTFEAATKKTTKLAAAFEKGQAKIDAQIAELTAPEAPKNTLSAAGAAAGVAA